MTTNKTCKQCSQQFEISDEDLEFYHKISPKFEGIVYKIPPPTLCPECRDTRRYNWRNERCLYKRKCDKTGKNIIAMYPPDSEFTIWDKDVWHKGDWDPMEYGQDFDPSKSFVNQFCELIKKIPRPSISLYNDEKCDYCNFVWDSKNCYLCFGTMETEDCMYSSRVFRSKNCVDCQDAIASEYCYECLTSRNCYKCQNCERCIECSESYFSYDCRGCRNIFMCVGLRNKQFYIRNKGYSKEEYLEALRKERLNLSSRREKLGEELKKAKGEFIFPENYSFKCENCTGDYLTECKNCKNCFFIEKSEDCKYAYFGNANIKNCYDFCQVADAEYCYEITGGSGYKNTFCPWPMYGDNNYYCNFCESCSNCFGCFGLKHKKFCILNKQYEEKEYNELVPKIIERMRADKEWGEFFPYWSSPFAFNETMASFYHPKSRKEALSFGAKWQDKDFSPKYDGPAYDPKDDINEYKQDENERTKLLKGVIKCQETGKPFKVMPQELVFYIENNVPLPMKHYDVRFKERFSRVNPRKLNHRQCMCNQKDHGHDGRCSVEFETTYSPDQKERVYCEKCYQRSIV